MEQSTTPLTTNEKLRSLRIDGERKTRAASAAGGLGWFVLGVAVGAAGAWFGITKFSPPSSTAGGVRPATTTSATQRPAGGSAEATATSTPSPARTPEPSAGSIVLTASGYVTPRHRVSLSPQVMGQVMWVGIEKGDRVEQGQQLVRLDDELYRSQLREAEARRSAAAARLLELETGSRPDEISRAEADVATQEANLANAVATLERRRALAAVERIDTRQALDDAIMNEGMARGRLEASRHTLELMRKGPRQEQIDAAKADLAAAEAAVQTARIQLEDTVISAPITGTILEKLIEVGELVTPQSFGGTRGARTELLSLADISDLQVEVDINEADFAKITMGQDARVTLDAYPDRKYRARVREIAPEANRLKATVQVKVMILDPDRFILPEMGARVDFLAGGK